MRIVYVDNKSIAYRSIIHPKQISEKGHNSVRKKGIKYIRLHAKLHTMGDHPRRFQDNPFKTVREVVVTIIYFICKRKY